MNKSLAFWKKVESCKHKDLYENYYRWGRCGTPHCSGWDEYHCRACGVFLTTCPCGAENGLSGWPNKRRAKSKRSKIMLGHCSKNTRRGHEKTTVIF